MGNEKCVQEDSQFEARRLRMRLKDKVFGIFRRNSKPRFELDVACRQRAETKGEVGTRISCMVEWNNEGGDFRSRDARHERVAMSHRNHASLPQQPMMGKLPPFLNHENSVTMRCHKRLSGSLSSVVVFTCEHRSMIDLTMS